MDAFSQLSSFYDQMVGADYQSICDFICNKIEKYNPSANLLVDLGCGSGTLSMLLSEKGYDIIGVDNSDAMLSKAIQKSTFTKDILWLQQDMTDLDLYGTVDVIICTLDGFNYLYDEDMLQETIRRCSLFLNPNGLLIFDVNTKYKYESILQNQCFVYETSDAYCIWETDKEDDDIYFDLTFFIKQKDGRYIRKEETQQQHYFSPDTIKFLLQQNKLICKEICDDYTKAEKDSENQRIVFIAQKE